jgi:hypothetical protein
MLISGITGAIALISINIIFLVLAGVITFASPHIEHVFEKYVNDWTIEGMNMAFIIIGFIGFTVGLYVWCCHSYLTHKYYKVTLGCCVPLVLISWMIYSYAISVEVPQKIKLADCTNIMTKINLTFPRGRYCRFVLNIQPVTTNKYSGRLNIAAGTVLVTNIVWNSDQLEQQCEYLHALTNYNLEFSFNQSPPPSISLWLYLFQTCKDRKSNN